MAVVEKPIDQVRSDEPGRSGDHYRRGLRRYRHDRALRCVPSGVLWRRSETDGPVCASAPELPLVRRPRRAPSMAFLRPPPPTPPAARSARAAPWCLDLTGDAAMSDRSAVHLRQSADIPRSRDRTRQAITAAVRWIRHEAFLHAYGRWWRWRTRQRFERPCVRSG